MFCASLPCFEFRSLERRGEEAIAEEGVSSILSNPISRAHQNTDFQEQEEPDGQVA